MQTQFQISRERIPTLLQSQDRWVVWQAGEIKPNGKFDKVPININTGRHVGHNDSKNWLSFRDACAAYDAGIGSGIGLVLTADPVGTWGDVLCGAPQYLIALDLDHCSDKLDKVKALQRDLGGIYGEVSPSQKGIRMFALSRELIKGGNAHEGRELYSTGRFVTVTGIKGHGQVIDSTEGLLDLSREWFPAKAPALQPRGLFSDVLAPMDAMTLALAGQQPETPESIQRVKSQLSCIDADCSYESWRNVVWATLSTGWNCAEELARDWSMNAVDRYDEAAFDRLLHSFDSTRCLRGGITLGTLDHFARVGGWSPLSAIQSTVPPMESSERATLPTNRLLTGEDLKAQPRLPWLVRGSIPSKGLASIYGPSGSAKTFLALDLACAIAAGHPVWFDAKVKAAPVAYVALEGEGGILQRVAAWEKHSNQKVPNSVRFALGNFTLMTGSDSVLLAAEIRRELGTGVLVIIDTLNQSAPGADENTSSDMGRIISNAKLLASAVDGVVVLIHHSGKDKSRGMRGHSSLFAAMDSVIEVDSNPSGRSWRISKSKDGITGVSHAFELVPYVVDQDEDGLDITSCAIRQIFQLRSTVKPVSGKNQVAALAALRGISSAHPQGIPIKIARQAVIDILDIPVGRRGTRATELISSLTEAGHLQKENEGVSVVPPQK